MNVIFKDVNKWGHDFHEFCNQEKRNRVVYNFFSSIPIDDVVTAIQNSNADNIHQFRFGLEILYHMGNLKDYFSEDLDSLKEFRQKIENTKFNNSPVLCDLALRLLKDKLDYIIKKLNE